MPQSAAAYSRAESSAGSSLGNEMRREISGRRIVSPIDNWTQTNIGGKHCPTPESQDQARLKMHPALQRTLQMGGIGNRIRGALRVGRKGRL